MELQELPDALKMIMKEQELTQKQLGKVWGRTQAWVSLVALGKQDVGFNKLRDLLGRVGYEVVIRRKSDEAEVKRRSFLANVATVTLLPSANGHPYRDPEYVTLLSERVERSLYGSGGLTTIPDAARHLRRVQSTVTGSKDARLLSAASSLARQISLVHYDARQISHAQEAGKLAVAFAQAAKNPGQQVSALNVMSVLYSYEGDGHRGQQYARQALTIPDIPPEEEAVAYTRLGRALGLLHEKRHSAMALDRAQEIASGLPGVQRARLIGGVGISLHDQGEWEAAQDTLEEAVKGVSPASPWLAANLMARQVQSALRASQPLRAVELMDTLGRVAPLVSSARLDEYLTEIMALSTPWRNVPEVKIMRQLLRTLLM